MRKKKSCVFLRLTFIKLCATKRFPVVFLVSEQAQQQEMRWTAAPAAASPRVNDEIHVFEVI